MPEGWMPKSARPVQQAAPNAWMPKSARPVKTMPQPQAESEAELGLGGNFIKGARSAAAGLMAPVDLAETAILRLPNLVPYGIAKAVGADEIANKYEEFLTRPSLVQTVKNTIDARTNSAFKPSEKEIAPDAVEFGAGMLAGGPLTGTAAKKTGQVAANAATAPVKTAVKGTKNAIAGAAARSPDELKAAAETMAETASKDYQNSRNIGVLFTPETSKGANYAVSSAINSGGKLMKNLHGDTMAVAKEFTSDLQKNKQISLDTLDQYRKLFSGVVKKNTDAINGANDDARVASMAINAIDDFVERLGQKNIAIGSAESVDDLVRGRAGWAKMRSFEKISDIVEKAQGDPNKIKAGFMRLSQNKKQFRGFTPEERKAILEAARSSKGEKVLRTLGKFGVDLGTDTGKGRAVVPFLTGSLGYAAAGPTGVAVPVAGTLANELSKLVGRGKAEQVLKLIESR